MSVGKGALDGDQFLHADQALIGQHAAEGLDPLLRPIGEVGHSALDHALPLATSLPEQNRGTRAAVGHALDVHGNYLNAISLKMQVLSITNMGTLCRCGHAPSANPVKQLRPKVSRIRVGTSR